MLENTSCERNTVSTVYDANTMEVNPSSIELSRKANGGYTLKPGYSWNPTVKDNKKEGLVEVFDDCGILTASLEYHNDMLNGRCMFYKDGILVRVVPYVDDFANGYGYEYDEFGDNRKTCYYKNGEKKSELKESEVKQGYYDEIDVNSGKVISICCFNDQHALDGMVYHFKDERIHRIAVYEDGREIRCVKEFEESVMREYDENGKKMYEGGFLDSLEKNYPWNGQGKEYDNDGVLKYKGEWKNGKRNGKGISVKNNRAYYNGMWKDDLPEGEGMLYHNGYLLFKGKNWVRGRLQLENGKCVTYEEVRRKQKVMVALMVKSKDDWKNLSRNVIELIIDACNEMEEDLVIEGFPYLVRIDVRKNSMKHLRSLKVCNCEMLEKFETEGSERGRDNNGYSAFGFVKSVEFSSLDYCFVFSSIFLD